MTIYEYTLLKKELSEAKKILIESEDKEDIDVTSILPDFLSKD